MFSAFRYASISAVILSLSGCGTYTPPISYRFESDNEAAFFVNAVAQHVRCEMRAAAIDAVKNNSDSVFWLKDWSGEVTMTLTITEKTTITPGVALNNPLPNATQTFANAPSVSLPQSFSIGLGVNDNHTSMRVVAITWFILFNELLKEREVACPSTGQALESNLRLRETLFMGLVTAKLKGGPSRPFVTGGPLQNIQYTLSFDVDRGASVTPTWRLLKVSANPSGTFIGVDRDRKDQLLITMGPATLSTDAKGRKLIPSALAPSSDVGNVHNIGRINLQLTQ